MTTPMFEERVEGSRIITIVIAAVALFAIFGLVAVQQAEGRVSLEAIAPAGIGFFIAAVILYNFRYLHIVLTTDEIVFGYRWIKKKVALVDIARFEVQEKSLKDFGGYGVRYGRGKVWGYFNRSGKGVYIKTTNDKRYFFCSNRAEEVVDILGQLYQQAKKQT